jgi:phosphohistidine phosphatase
MRYPPGMDIYLIRHGRAEPRGSRAADEERELTREGRDRLAAIAHGLSALGVELDLVLTSPWRRAAATAEYLADLGAPAIRETRGLARPPDSALLEEIRGDAVACVGHEPWMSELLAWLVTGDPGAGGAFALKKGGVARLLGKPRPGGARLMAIIPPNLFLTLGRKRPDRPAPRRRPPRRTR